MVNAGGRSDTDARSYAGSCDGVGFGRRTIGRFLHSLQHIHLSAAQETRLKNTKPTWPALRSNSGDTISHSEYRKFPRLTVSCERM
jgi:hypothetical protein